MYEHPKGIVLRVTGNDEEADDEVDALGVTHFRKKYCDAF
jgi:hypothetical protein